MGEKLYKETIVKECVKLGMDKDRALEILKGIKYISVQGKVVYEAPEEEDSKEVAE